MTCLTLEHPGESETPLTMTWGLDPAALETYSRYYVGIDPFQAPIAAAPEGSVEFGEPLVPRAELVRTEIFNDWYRPNGLSTDSLGGVVMRRGGVPSVLGVYQTHDAPGYGKDALDLTQLLMPHMRRALEIYYRLGRSARSAATLLAVLDDLAFGVILVDARGRLTAANRVARELAGEPGGILLKGGEVRGGRPEETRAVQSAVAAAIAAEREGTVVSGTTVALRRTPPRRPLELTVLPLRIRNEDGGPFDAASAAIFVTDPDCIFAAPSDQLQALYGLTPREAAVAAELSEGRSPREIAERLGISVNTVKVRLQEVFAKTGTNRQPDLMRLLLSHASRIRLDS
jgi:DNA-binding CsgD family transcriptional regulator